MLVDGHDWDPPGEKVKISTKRGPIRTRLDTVSLYTFALGMNAPKKVNLLKHQPGAKVTVRVTAPAHYGAQYLQTWKVGFGSVSFDGTGTVEAGGRPAC